MTPGEGPTFRPATPDDLPTCASIWRESLNDYLVRLGQPEVPDDLGPILRLYGPLDPWFKKTWRPDDIRPVK